MSAFNKEAVIQLQVTRKETKEENTAAKYPRGNRSDKGSCINRRKVLDLGNRREGVRK